MESLEDFLKIRKRKYDGLDVYEVKLDLKMVKPISKNIPPEIEEEIRKAELILLKYDYLEKLFKLGFEWLEKRKLRNCRFYGNDIIVVPYIREGLIIMHPNTFAKFLNDCTYMFNFQEIFNSKEYLKDREKSKDGNKDEGNH